MAKFNIFEGFVKDDEKEIITMKKNNNIAPEIMGARRYWFTVMAPAIKAARKAAEENKTWLDAKSDLVHTIRNKCADRAEYLHTEMYVWEVAFEKAAKEKVEREKRRAAAAAANLARREAAAAEKRARQSALASRHLEKQNSLTRIAVAIGWAVDTVADAIKAIRNGVENATTKAYKAALKSVRRERLNAASMFTAIGELVGEAMVAMLHGIGLSNENAIAESVAY